VRLQPQLALQLSHFVALLAGGGVDRLAAGAGACRHGTTAAAGSEACDAKAETSKPTSAAGTGWGTAPEAGAEAAAEAAPNDPHPLNRRDPGGDRDPR
jgi:hypothetical protein